MHFFRALRSMWLATSVSVSSFWLVNTYFWSFFSWLTKSGCQNLKLAGNTFPPFPSFWSPGNDSGNIFFMIQFFFLFFSSGFQISLKKNLNVKNKVVLRNTVEDSAYVLLGWLFKGLFFTEIAKSNSMYCFGFISAKFIGWGSPIHLV